MAGVGPGTTIGGRFALRTIAHRAPRGQRWSALDVRTGLPASVLLVPESSPVAEAVAEAARRVAGMNDPGLVEVLDSGKDAGYTYVAEAAPDAPTLTELLDAGPLAAEEARRVVGECSLTLERARQRGLHHRELTPDSVRIAPDGAVILRGLALDAALADAAPVDGRAASRADATGLTALLYAALTGTWPLTGTPLTPSPRIGGRVLPPSELAGGIDADLDAAATAGLSAAPDAPVIPGDVAESLAPWNDAPVGRIVETGPAATEALPVLPHVDPSQLPDELRGDIEHPPSRAAIAASAVGGVVAAGGRATADAARQATRQAVERAAERRRDDAERREAEKRSERSFGEIAETAAARPEPVVPVFASDVQTSTPSRSQARFVLGFLGAFVAVSAVLGAIGVASTVSTIGKQFGGGSSNSPVAAAPGTPAPSHNASTSAAPAPSAPIPIVGVQSFDPPPGDGNENDAALGNLKDDNPATTWQTSKYKTANFGGIKQGVGVVLDLGQPAAVRTIEVDVADDAPGIDYTVYATDSRPTSIDGLTRLGSATDAKGASKVTVDKPADHQFVVVWITKPAEVPGGFRAKIAEIKPSS